MLDRSGIDDVRASTTGDPFFWLPLFLLSPVFVLNLWVGIDVINASNVDLYIKQTGQLLIYVLGFGSFALAYVYLGSRT